MACQCDKCVYVKCGDCPDCERIRLTEQIQWDRPILEVTLHEGSTFEDVTIVDGTITDGFVMGCSIKALSPEEVDAPAGEWVTFEQMQELEEEALSTIQLTADVIASHKEQIRLLGNSLQMETMRNNGLADRIEQLEAEVLNTLHPIQAHLYHDMHHQKFDGPIVSTCQECADLIFDPDSVTGQAILRSMEDSRAGRIYARRTRSAHSDDCWGTGKPECTCRNGTYSDGWNIQRTTEKANAGDIESGWAQPDTTVIKEYGHHTSTCWDLDSQDCICEQSIGAYEYIPTPLHTKRNCPDWEYAGCMCRVTVPHDFELKCPNWYDTMCQCP